MHPLSSLGYNDNNSYKKNNNKKCNDNKRCIVTFLSSLRVITQVKLIVTSYDLSLRCNDSLQIKDNVFTHEKLH